MWAQTRHRAIQVKNVLCTRWVMRHCDELGHVARIAEGNTIIDNRGHESDRRADAVKIGSGTQLGPYCFVSDTEAGGLDSPDMSPARGQRRIVLGGEVLFSRGPIQAQIAVFHTGVCRIGDHVYSGPSRGGRLGLPHHRCTRPSSLRHGVGSRTFPDAVGMDRARCPRRRIHHDPAGADHW